MNVELYYDIYRNIFNFSSTNECILGNGDVYVSLSLFLSHTLSASNDGSTKLSSFTISVVSSPQLPGTYKANINI